MYPILTINNISIMNIINKKFLIFFLLDRFSTLYSPSFLHTKKLLINIIKSFFPVSLETYWYFTAYFWLVALMPCLDYVIQKIDGIYYFVFLIVGYIILLNYYILAQIINNLFPYLLFIFIRVIIHNFLRIKVRE